MRFRVRGRAASSRKPRIPVPDDFTRCCLCLPFRALCGPGWSAYTGAGLWRVVSSAAECWAGRCGGLGIGFRGALLEGLSYVLVTLISPGHS